MRNHVVMAAMGLWQVAAYAKAEPSFAWADAERELKGRRRHKRRTLPSWLDDLEEYRQQTDTDSFGLGDVSSEDPDRDDNNNKQYHDTPESGELLAPFIDFQGKGGGSSPKQWSKGGGSPSDQWGNGRYPDKGGKGKSKGSGKGKEKSAKDKKGKGHGGEKSKKGKGKGKGYYDEKKPMPRPTRPIRPPPRPVPQPQPTPIRPVLPSAPTRPRPIIPPVATLRPVTAPMATTAPVPPPMRRPLQTRSPIVPTRRPVVRPTMSPTTRIVQTIPPTATATMTAPASAVDQVPIVPYYIAFVAPLADREPTEDEYLLIAQLTTLYFEEIFAALYENDPAVTFLRVQSNLTNTKFEADIPEPDFNLYMAFNTSVVFAAASRELPASADLFAIMDESIGTSYIVDYVWQAPETPFISAQEAILNPVNGTTTKSAAATSLTSRDYSLLNLAHRFILPGSRISASLFRPDDNT
jgi:hypothetical protein